MPEFGTSFKAAREAKDLTIEQIAQETRIGTRFLRAIEDEAFHVLPGGVFNRGFIRTYAERIGLDSEKKLSEYAALTSDPGTPELQAVGTASLSTSSDRHVLPIALGALVVVIFLYYASSMSRRADAERPVDSSTLSESGATLSRPGSGVARSNAGSVSSPPRQPVTEAVPNPATPAVASTPTDTTPAEIPHAAGIRIQLDVHNATWISLLSDGQQIVEGVTLEPGTRRNFEADEEVELRIGNAAGLTLTINGEEVPDLGLENQVRNLRITRNGFRFF